MGFIKDNTNTFEVYLTDLGKQKFFDGGLYNSIKYFSISDNDANYDLFSNSGTTFNPNIITTQSIPTINHVNENITTLGNLENIGIKDVFVQVPLRGKKVDNIEYKKSLFGVKETSPRTQILQKTDNIFDTTLNILTFLDKNGIKQFGVYGIYGLYLKSCYDVEINENNYSDVLIENFDFYPTTVQDANGFVLTNVNYDRNLNSFTGSNAAPRSTSSTVLYSEIYKKNQLIPNEIYYNKFTLYFRFYGADFGDYRSETDYDIDKLRVRAYAQLGSNLVQMNLSDLEYFNGSDWIPVDEKDYDNGYGIILETGTTDNFLDLGYNDTFNYLFDNYKDAPNEYNFRMNVKVSNFVTKSTKTKDFKIIFKYFGITERELQLTANVTNITCNGENDGAINLTVNGGIEPYSFLWSNGMTEQNISGLSGGTYNVTVTDDEGRTETLSVVVTEPDALQLSARTYNGTCNGDYSCGVELTISGGIGPYTFQWSDGSTDQNIYGLNGGTYSVTVTDANNCQITDSFDLIEPDQLVINMTVVKPCNVTLGSLSAAVSGGWPPYSYLWSNEETTSEITGLATGTYILTVVDSAGCNVVSDSYQIDGLTVSTTGDSINGQIIVNINYGDSPYNLVILRNNVPHTTISAESPGIVTFDDLLTGTREDIYDLTITDDNGCEYTEIFDFSL